MDLSPSGGAEGDSPFFVKMGTVPNPLVPNIEPGDRVVLIIEDDPRFAAVMVDVAEKKGFKGVVATEGHTGLDWAKTLSPDAITLDIHLPDMDGWVVLDQLKHTSETRHIPVHVISVVDDPQRALLQGAIAYLVKFPQA